MTLVMGSKLSVEIALKYAIPIQDQIIKVSVCFRLFVICFLRITSIHLRQ